ncbi:MAG: hypothetical protein LCH34_14570 [Firmicutes bacterium]|nr:hypothetical protein [Bacillota bacterium]
MKRNRTIGLLLLIILTAAITYYLVEIPIPKILPEKVTMVTLPSPPMAKEITDPETIQTLFTLIEEAKLKPDIRSMMVSEKGYQLRIVYSGGELTFLGDRMTYMGRHFVVENTLRQDLMDLYHQSTAEEKPWLP